MLKGIIKVLIGCFSPIRAMTRVNASTVGSDTMKPFKETSKEERRYACDVKRDKSVSRI